MLYVAHNMMQLPRLTVPTNRKTAGAPAATMVPATIASNDTAEKRLKLNDQSVVVNSTSKSDGFKHPRKAKQPRNVQVDPLRSLHVTHSQSLTVRMWKRLTKPKWTILTPLLRISLTTPRGRPLAPPKKLLTLFHLPRQCLSFYA